MRSALSLVWIVWAVVWTTGAQADPKTELRTRLQQLDSFSADFVQQVHSEDGELLHQAEGVLKVQRPLRFYWHALTPDESLIVGDGQAVWVYNPFLEQASVYDMANATEQSPFVLLADDRDSVWQQYQVSGSGDQYRILADATAQVSAVTLRFQPDSPALISVQVTDVQGQVSTFSLEDAQVNPALNAEQFQFVPPQGTDIDDQRHDG